MAAQFLCVKACNLLLHFRVLKTPPLPTAHLLQPFVCASDSPVVTQPAPLAEETFGYRLVPEFRLGNKEVLAPPISHVLCLGDEFQRTCEEFYIDSYAQVSYHFSGYASVHYTSEDGDYLAVRHPPRRPL